MLSHAEQQRYREDGVVLVRGAVDPQLITRMNAAVEALMQQPSRFGANITAPGNPGMYFQDRRLFPHNAEFRSLLHDVGLAEMAATAMRSATVRAFYEHVFVKEPGTRESFVWHQDRPYWNVDGTQVCSTWVALTAASVESSSLQFVRGSHLWGRTFRPEYPGLEGRSPEELERLLWRGLAEHVRRFDDRAPAFEEHPDDYDVIGFDVTPGDVVLFDFRTVHRSGPNAGRARRAAISWRWLGDDAIWTPRTGGDPIIREEETRLRFGDPITDDVVFPPIYPPASTA